MIKLKKKLWFPELKFFWVDKLFSGILKIHKPGFGIAKFETCSN